MCLCSVVSPGNFHCRFTVTEMALWDVATNSLQNSFRGTIYSLKIRLSNLFKSFINTVRETVPTSCDDATTASKQSDQLRHHS